jgi:hypothetical protein
MAAGLDYGQVRRFFYLIGAESEVLEMHLRSSKSSPDAKKHSRPEGMSMLAWIVGTPKMNCNMVLLALEVLSPRLGVQKPASETPPDAEKEAFWAIVKAKKAAEQAERDAEREAARQAKLAAAASKARRDARAQRLGFADFKALHRELYLRRCARAEAKYAKAATALASVPAVPLPEVIACTSTPAPSEPPAAPHIETPIAPDTGAVPLKLFLDLINSHTPKGRIDEEDLGAWFNLDYERATALVDAST